MPDNGDPVIFFGGTGEPTINQLLSGTYDPGSGPVNMVGTYSITSDEEDGAQIGTIFTQNFEEITFNAVCFVRGTRIETDRGPVPIERLAVGDRVMTLDHGPQPIRWIASTKSLALGPMAPIRIAAETLGNDTDLWVSAQHRMLLRDWRLELLFAETECFVPAKALVNGSTIRQVEAAPWSIST